MIVHVCMKKYTPVVLKSTNETLQKTKIFLTSGYRTRILHTINWKMELVWKVFGTGAAPHLHLCAVMISTHLF